MKYFNLKKEEVFNCLKEGLSVAIIKLA